MVWTKNRRAHGFTLTELVVVFGVIAVIVSLTVLAVNAARESSRKVACQNNLHQIGSALAQVVNRNNRFPPVYGPQVPNPDKLARITFTNPFVAIATELEIAFKLNRIGEVLIDDKPDGAPRALRCPSADEYLAYKYNFGATPTVKGDQDGMLRFFKGISPAEVTDGLSNTCLVSERIAGVGRTTLAAIASVEASSTADFDGACQGAASAGHFRSDAGERWWEFQTPDISYDHTKVPNSKIYDCHGIAFDGTRREFMQSIAARSYHSGGVFTLKADSSVIWVASNIDLITWKAMATPAGGEPVAVD